MAISSTGWRGAHRRRGPFLTDAARLWLRLALAFAAGAGAATAFLVWLAGVW